MQTEHRSNNFDFIRLVAAASVLVSHQYVLLFQPEPHPFGLLTFGTLGVLIFFSVSGYLVAQSWQRDPRPLPFAIKRFLRIWPGLVVLMCLSVFLVGPIMTNLPVKAYFHTPETWGYFSMLYLKFKIFLPGVFQHNPWYVANGSLWTIPVEVKWYAILLAFGVCGLLKYSMRYLLLAGWVAYSIYIYAIFDVQHNPAAAFLLPAFGCEYGAFFCYGVMLHYFREQWVGRFLPILCGVAVLATIFAWLDHGYAALYVILPFLVIGIGSSSTPVLRRVGRYGDFSYGIYIYAYLVQQLWIAAVGIRHPYWANLLASTFLTLICAVISWHLIERPALAFKRNLRNWHNGRTDAVTQLATQVEPSSSN